MPYIPAERKLDIPTRFLHRLDDPNAGDLNYIFTMIAHEYIAHHGLRYQYINDVVGALEGAKVEFQRRVVGPYENKAIAKNGDVMHWLIDEVLHG